MRRTHTRVGTSGAQLQAQKQTTASYYTRTSSLPVDRNAKKKYTGYLLDWSSEDHYNDHTYVAGREYTSPMTNIDPFHSSSVGLQKIGLRSIKPANKKLGRLMSYRSYPVMITTEQRSSRDTAEIRVYIKNLTLTLKNHAFDGNDRIKILDFLTRFLNYSGILEMSEAEAFILIPIFLADPAEIQFRTKLSEASRYGGVSCCPEAIQYLLKTYETASSMSEVLEDLRNIR